MSRTSSTLHRWRQAGLLDDDASARILAWEASQSRPVWLWALAGTGGFAVVLGIVAIIAANWDAIPGGVKIATHLALDAAMAGALFLAWRTGRDRMRELLALVLFGLVLTGIGLIGQVYQLGGTTWQAMLTWMLVCTPFLGVLTRSGLLAVAWSLSAFATYLAAIPRLSRALASVMHLPSPASYDWPGRNMFIMALVWVFAAALLAVGILRGLQPGRQAQGGWTTGVATLLLLAAASWPSLQLRLDGHASSLVWGQGWSLAVTVVLLVPALALDRRRHGRVNLVLAALPVAGWLTWWLTVRAWLAFAPPDSARGTDAAQLAVALVFIAFWGVVSWLALHTGRRGAFIAAFAVIALRVFLFYWEAFGGLLSTGLGLIGGGALCLALAAVGWRLAQHAAPMPPRIAVAP